MLPCVSWSIQEASTKPLKNSCLCILKYFCCWGCYCCFWSAETVATTPQISDGREISEWQLLCCMIYYRSKVSKWGLGLLWLSDGQMLSFFCQRGLPSECDTSVCLGILNSCYKDSNHRWARRINRNMIHPNFLAPRQHLYNEGGRSQGGGITGMWVQLIC